MTYSDVDDPMVDEAWLAAPAKTPRLQRLLLAVLAASLCFLGGAVVQKQFGSADAAAAASANPFTQGALPDGVVPEGFPSGGAVPTTGDDGTSGGDSGTEGDAVIGTVVSATDRVLVVKDLGGKRHRITVGADTDVVRESTAQLADLRAGDVVDVSGSVVDGQLQADHITLR